MQRILCGRWIAGLGLMGALLTMSGCGPDLKKENAQLQEKINGLNKDLEDANAKAAQAGAALQKAQADLADANNQIDGLKRNQGVPADQLTDAQKRIQELEEQLKKAGGADGTWKLGEGFAMTELPMEILFDPGSAKLKPSGMKALQAIIKDLKGRFAGMNVMVVGNTDTDPIRKSRKLWQDNWDLSTGRALAVVRYLQSQGLPPAKLLAGGVGEYRPRASNTVKTGKRQNRRVEIYAYNQKVTK